MKRLPLQRRTLALVAVIVPLLALLIYVALRSGPLAPVAVTEANVVTRAIHPALFGIGTVEARYTYKIGPTLAGRVKRLDVHVGDPIKAGELLGEMDPVDLGDKVRAQEAALRRAEAAIEEAMARHTFAKTQAQRYENLYVTHSVSEEALTTKRQELAIAKAALAAAEADLLRVRSDLDALAAQQRSLRLISPVDGVVTLREVDPGTTVVAGQTVVELIDPESLWVNVRFDQISASGLAADLPATIVLRSHNGQPLKGRVLRVELKADAVTEETLAKVVFDEVLSPLPPIGELAEVTVDLPALAVSASIPNAAIQRQGNQPGVWQINNGKPIFIPVKLGRSDLDGHVQVLDGLKDGDRIVVYSEKALGSNSLIRVVERIPGVLK